MSVSFANVSRMDCASKSFSSARLSLSRSSRDSSSARLRASSKATTEPLASAAPKRCEASPNAADKSMHFCCSASNCACRAVSCWLSCECSASSLAMSLLDRSSTPRTLMASSCFCLSSSSRCFSNSATRFLCSLSKVSSRFSCSSWNSSPLRCKLSTSAVKVSTCRRHASSSLDCSFRAFSCFSASNLRAFSCSSFFCMISASSFSISSLTELMLCSLCLSACSKARLCAATTSFRSASTCFSRT
mmetsp:Transcript_44137/g.101930  ORF Transcript_44137/g.101930 Transcript_44137/m.101930 type:complete len:246 (+) Transcript_44137:611-1348(+)